MRPNAAARNVHSGGVTASGEFGISRENEAHIMNILRDTLYSDKVLAVLREYSANAWDANRDNGRYDVPIKVTLPTEMDPVLKIRDYGPGLSPEDVFTVYTQYGASTKRSDDNSVGMLGIGSKSGFAYADSFTVTSWHKGWKRMYIAVLDESDKGVMNMLLEEPCDFEDSGVEVQIAVKSEDIDDFEKTAKKLFKYFDPLPDINIKLPVVTEEKMRTSEGVLWRSDYDDHEWTAVMGCVPYAVDIDQIVETEIDGESCGDYIRRLCGILYFKIGEVEISASRERLKYSNKTKKTLIRKVNHVVDEYVRKVLEEIRTGQFTAWEKRVRAQILTELKLPVPDELKEEVKSIIKIERGQFFYLIRRGGDEKSHTEHISIADSTRLLRRDEDKVFAGYNLREYDYVVHLVGTSTWDQANKELAEKLEKAGLEGIPIENMSKLEWTAPYRPPVKAAKKANTKHKVRTFRLDPAKPFCHPYSNCWVVDNRVPTDDDVYVVLKNFKALDKKDFYGKYKIDTEYSDKLGDGSMPIIYGYKTTEKKPVDVSTLKGKEYFTWRRDFVRGLITPDVEREIQSILWSQLSERSHGYYLRSRDFSDIVTLFDKKHPLVQVFAKQVSASKKLRQMGWERKQVLAKLIKKFGYEKTSQAMTYMAAIFDRYPLLKVVESNLSVFWGKHQEQWAEYVRLIDRTIPVASPQEPAEQEETQDNDASTTVHDH